MPYPSLTFEQLLDNATRTELEQLVALLQGFLAREHNDDGTHSDLTAETVTVSGVSTFNDDVTINANATVVGTATDPKTFTVNVDGTNTGRWGTTTGWQLGYFINKQPVWVGVNGSISGRISFFSSNTFTLGSTPSPAAHVYMDGADVLQLSNGYGTGRVNIDSQYFSIPDGVTAPSAVVGVGILYIDQADGDLKIMFGDGTVKTIVTD